MSPIHLWRFHVAVGSLLFWIGCRVPQPEVESPSPTRPPMAGEEKAVSFLVREVPAWSRENGCFSCHNNGDAARALMLAKARGHEVPDQALKDTLEWLDQPRDWDHNKGDPGFSDKRLARIQFAAALLDARRQGWSRNPQALQTAARGLVGDQESNGSWPIGAQSSLGSPATYGPVLATVLAARVLRESVPDPAITAAIAKSDQWLMARPIGNVVDAAALLWHLDRDDSPAAQAKRRQCLDYLEQAKTIQGAWGPYPNDPPECFDTALVLIALATLPPTPSRRTLIASGRAYLLETQLEDGSWPETTRPPGGQSYAQLLSTTGWATLALLFTSNPEPTFGH